VADVPTTLTGRMDPGSDTGISAGDRITNDATPTFLGTSEPGSIVQVFAQVPGGRARRWWAGAVTDAAGAWQITGGPLPDGVIVFTATALDAGGVRTAVTPLGTLTIDTVGPRVTGVQFNRAGGRVLVGFRDDRSGLDGRSLIDGIELRVHAAGARRGRFLITNLAAAPATELGATVTVTVNGGRRLRRGSFTLLVRSGGVQDVAGNALDGEFLGALPSGNGLRGGDLVARLDSLRNRNRIRAAAPAGGTATPRESPSPALRPPTRAEGRRVRPR
jgi:hypothetical protein